MVTEVPGQCSVPLRVSEEVRCALADRVPLVALESAVLTHGLTDPHHLRAARLMEEAIRAAGAVPALCLVQDGALWVGANYEQAEAVSCDPRREKASVRDLGLVLASGVPAGLTVSATLLAAHQAGIRVFATGGIGGVHRNATESGDISADLGQLARTPVITVCAGAKSVLDIPRTLEFLEMAGVPVFAFGTPCFPAFYLRDSGCTVPALYSPYDVALAVRRQWDLGHETGVVVGNPLPAEEAICPADWDAWLAAAERDALAAGVRGKQVTPFLLERVADLSDGRTVRANLALLAANAQLAAEIAGIRQT